MSLKKIVAETDRIVKSTLKNFLPNTNIQELNATLKHIINLKRNYDRALFARISCEMAGGDWKKHLPIWAALEIIDCCVLALDDIIDHSSTRLSSPTVHYEWGLEKALLAIEFYKSNAISIVIEHLVGTDIEKVPNSLILIEKMYQGIQKGQYLDICYEEKGISEVSIENLINMVKLTTGIQIAICGELGVFIGDGAKQMQKDFYKFGMLIGTLFQIRDDYIDYYEDDILIGKPSYLDLLDGKKRFPVVLAYNSMSNKNNKRKLQNYCKSTHDIGLWNARPNNKLDNSILNTIKNQITKKESKQKLFSITNSLKSEAERTLKSYENYKNYNYMMQLLELSTSFE